jgi:hypothetical protein
LSEENSVIFTAGRKNCESVKIFYAFLQKKSVKTLNCRKICKKRKRRKRHKRRKLRKLRKFTRKCIKCVKTVKMLQKTVNVQKIQKKKVETSAIPL